MGGVGFEPGSTPRQYTKTGATYYRAQLGVSDKDLHKRVDWLLSVT